MRATATAIALALLATTPVLAQIQTPDPDPAQHQAAVDAVNAAYAEMLGVSVPEALAYQRKVGKAVELHERFRNRPDYAGFRIAPGKQFRASFSFTGDARAALNSATSEAGFEPRQVALAAPGIQQAFDKVDAVLERWKQPHTVYYDDRDQRIKVHVRPGTNVRGVLAGVSVALPVDVIEDGMIVQSTASIEGGRPSSTSTHNLTTGFAVIHEDKREGITTAGHATNGSLTVKGYPLAFAGELYGAGKRDIQWHSATGHSYPPLVYIATNGGLLTIQAVNSLGEGVPVCMQGTVNPNRCGRTLQLINNGYDNLGNRFENAVSFARDDNTRMVSEGDSGASMVTADYGIGRAHGVNFGGTNPINTTDFRTGYYVKSSDFYLLNLTIKTRPPY